MNFTKLERQALVLALDNLHQPLAVPLAAMPHILSARQKLAAMDKAAEPTAEPPPPES